MTMFHFLIGFFFCTDYDNNFKVVCITFLNYILVLESLLNFYLYGHLWSSVQSSWLQIRRPGFDSWHCQKKKVVGLERGPLSFVSTTEELLDRKVAAPV
jgi:hypothetical protein